MDSLRNYIIHIILSKKSESIDEKKYAKVIAALSTNLQVDNICSYIMRCVEQKVVSKGIVPSNNTILDVLTAEFCVDKAHEYLMYLENSHEHLDEYEYLFGR